MYVPWIDRLQLQYLRKTASTSEDAQTLAMAESLTTAIALVKKYRPRPVEAGLVYFDAVESGHWSRSWKGMATHGVEVHEVPGEHLDMLEHPAVVSTAMLVDQALRRQTKPHSM